MSESTISLPDNLLRAVFQSLVPHCDMETDGSTELERELVISLADAIEANEPVCDHSVGICACFERETLAELRLRLAGKMTCPKCNQDGVVWNERQMDEATFAYVRQHGGTLSEARDALGDDPGYAKCPRCEGSCVVPLESAEA